MISLTELAASEPFPVELVFQNGVEIIASVISVDPDAAINQIFYEPLIVLRAPPDSMDQPGRYLATSAEDVVSWRLYTGPLMWELTGGAHIAETAVGEVTVEIASRGELTIAGNRWVGTEPNPLIGGRAWQAAEPIAVQSADETRVYRVARLKPRGPHAMRQAASLERWEGGVQIGITYVVLPETN